MTTETKIQEINDALLSDLYEAVEDRKNEGGDVQMYRVLSQVALWGKAGPNMLEIDNLLVRGITAEFQY